MRKIAEVLRLAGIKRGIRNFFLVKDGGKEVIRTTRAMLVAAVVVLVGAGITLFFSQQDDTSVWNKTDKPIVASSQTPAAGIEASGTVGSLLHPGARAAE